MMRCAMRVKSSTAEDTMPRMYFYEEKLAGRKSHVHFEWAIEGVGSRHTPGVGMCML